VEDAVGGDRGREHGCGEVDLGQLLQLPPGRQDQQRAVLVAGVDLAVGEQRRAPDAGLRVELPDFLAAGRVEAVNESGEVGDVDQAVGDRGGGDGTVDLVVAPDGARS